MPFHWPFVAYGWLASGMFAVWGETILRLFEIEKDGAKTQELPTSDRSGWRLRLSALSLEWTGAQGSNGDGSTYGSSR